MLPSRPAEAAFLTPDEKGWITTYCYFVQPQAKCLTVRPLCDWQIECLKAKRSADRREQEECNGYDSGLRRRHHHTDRPRTALDERLNSTGVNVVMSRLTDQYITVVAEDALDKFMVKNWPDDQLFSDLVMGLIERARTGGRSVRALGEIVALL